MTVSQQPTTKFDNMELGGVKSDKICTALACVGDERIKIKNRAQITLRQGLFKKYEEEIHFKVFAHKKFPAIHETRNQSAWNTIEIVVPKDEGILLMRKFLDEYDSNKMEGCHQDG